MTRIIEQRAAAVGRILARQSYGSTMAPECLAVVCYVLGVE